MKNPQISPRKYAFAIIIIFPDIFYFNYFSCLILIFFLKKVDILKGLAKR